MLFNLLLICHIALFDDLGNEKKLSGIWLGFDEPAEDWVLHQAHHENFLFEASLVFDRTVFVIDLADDWDKQVE